MDDQTATIPHGALARDRITRFTGVVTGYANYLCGPDHYQLTPEVSEKGEHRQSQWFEAQRLEVLAEDAIALRNDDKNGAVGSPPPARAPR